MASPKVSFGLTPALGKAMRRVARIADGWMTVQIFPRMFAANWSKLREFLAVEGRDPEAFPNIAYHNINIGPDRSAALEESKRFLDEYYGPVFAPPMVEAWTAAGTPAQCVEHLRELIRDGARAITLRLTSRSQKEQYQRLVNEVLPRINQ
jgi:alkanesulfonate monooxygenase SsuD/methylene tetrahydromethanopterin reductase-like flavin-dependent oxidoreductase (luciferase family)